MNKQQAQQIIRDTLESSFDKNGFTWFIKNLLNKIEDAPFTYQGNYIPDAYKQYIKTLERIGKFSDAENSIDILVITLQKETSLEHARTMQRNFIAWYLNGSRGGKMKDAALAAFVSPDKADWRFSLVKIDYKFEKTKTGRLKVKEEFTPARRWSFLVGANEKSHTAQSRLVNILANDEQAPTLKEIENAFDIETVTKEFFLKYRELFLRTKDELDRVMENNPKVEADFEAKGMDTVNFTKKLLGQIVFLYFLQKKGWFGVERDDAWGTGSKQFLRELFRKKHGDYNNFFNDILEPLFYEALRIDRRHDDGYYSRFNCKIPFLNGGLFDPIGNYDWVHTDILLSDGLFSNENKTKEGDHGDGILDIFDRYNFTVMEDEPLEKEVAIDPELLGKAYEKFNAIRPDNYDKFKKALKSGRKGEENKFNKKFGVYYTPREIVHYMCQQSLINYLYTSINNSAISYNKIGDNQTDTLGNKAKKGQLNLTSEHRLNPKMSKKDIETLIHIGEHISENEAWVISTGKETKTYSRKLSKSIRDNAPLIDAKLAEITVCDPAVGSGAFPVGMMSEIVKIRNVLSKFVQDKTRTTYEFKRRCIEHSLFGVDIDPGAVEIAKLRLWLSLVVDEVDIINIKPLPNLDYKIVRGNSLIGFPEDWESPIVKEIERLKDDYLNETNPTNKNSRKKTIDEKLNKRYENSLKTFGYKIDFDFRMVFSEVFHEQASPERRRSGGFDVVIANPPYIRIHKQDKRYKEQIKRLYYSAFKDYDIYILFFEKSLNILKNNGVMTYITPDKYLIREYGNKIRKLLLDNKIIELFDVSRAKDIFNAATYPLISIFMKSPSDELITSKFARTIKNIYQDFEEIQIDHSKCKENNLIELIHPNNRIILDKIYRNSKYLSDILTKKQIFCGTPRAKDYHSWPKYITKEKNGRNSLRLLVCSHMVPYHIDKKKIVRTLGLSIKEPYFINKIGAVSESRWVDFKFVPKILIRGNDTRLTSVLDEIGSVFIGIYGIKAEGKIKNNYKFLLALLNSELYQWIFSIKNHSVKIAGDFFSINTPQLMRLPYKENSSQERDIIIIVDQILHITKDNKYLQNQQKQAKVKSLETKIDQLVYKIYDLTPDEIKIVEGENSK